MFDNFSGKITKIFDSISGKKFVSEDDLAATMREIRIALLEADVSLPIAKDFIEKVKAESLGQQVVKSVSPGQMIVKIVHDELVKLLGGTKAEINFNCLFLILKHLFLRYFDYKRNLSHLNYLMKNHFACLKIPV